MKLIITCKDMSGKILWKCVQQQPDYFCVKSKQQLHTLTTKIMLLG